MMVSSRSSLRKQKAMDRMDNADECLGVGGFQFLN